MTTTAMATDKQIRYATEIVAGMRDGRALASRAKYWPSMTREDMSDEIDGLLECAGVSNRGCAYKSLSDDDIACLDETWG